MFEQSRLQVSSCPIAHEYLSFCTLSTYTTLILIPSQSTLCQSKLLKSFTSRIMRVGEEAKKDPWEPAFLSQVDSRPNIGISMFTDQWVMRNWIKLREIYINNGQATLIEEK